MSAPPCPENWESCDWCGARPNETCRDPDVTKGDRVSFKGIYADETLDPKQLRAARVALDEADLPADVNRILAGQGVETVSTSVNSEEVSRSSLLKLSNPKEAVGIRKVPMSTVSAPVLAEVGVAMLEGARKYGRHNYRASGVRASVYYDAALRHIMQWWEGEDIDPDSGLSHVTKAITSLIVLRDSTIQGTFNDDRPPRTGDGWMRRLQPVIEDIFEQHPESAEAFTCKD